MNMEEAWEKHDVDSGFGPEPREELAPTPSWAVGPPVGSAVPVAAQVPVDVVRVALLRAAGVVDTVAVGEALGMSPAQVCALECDEGFVHVVKRLRLAAGLGSWRSHVESVVATGVLPSGVPAMSTTQAGFLKDLWDREEPKAVDQGATHVLVLTGDAMARMRDGLAEAARPVVDVTPRTEAPAMDAELERQIQRAKEVAE